MVRGQLAPRPAFGVDIVDRDALTLERFGIERRFGVRLMPQRRLRLDDFHHAAFDVTLGRHLALKRLRGDIGAGRRDARIEGAHYNLPLIPANAGIQTESDGAAITTMGPPLRGDERLMVAPLISWNVLAVARGQKRVERGAGLAFAAFRAAGFGRR